MAPKKIVMTEIHRIGSSVQVEFHDEDGNDLLPGGRYYNAETDDQTGFDQDKEHILASFAQELADKPVPEAPIEVEKPVVFEMDQEAIQTKLASIEAARQEKQEKSDDQ